MLAERWEDPAAIGHGDINEMIIRPLLSNASVVALFMIPMITMRLFAEEKKTGTIELLMTSPVRDIEIILGKFLGASDLNVFQKFEDSFALLVRE